MVSEKPKIKGTMFIDSAGRKESGRFRSGISMVNESLFGHRDPLNLSVTKAPGSLSAMASYDFSLNPQGSRIGWRFDTSSMKVISGEYESLDIRALNVGQTFTFTTPIRVEPQNLVDGFLEYRWKTARTFFSGVELLKNQTTTMVVGLNTKRQISSGLFNSTQALTIGYGDAAEDKVFAKLNGAYNWLLAHGKANEVRLQTMFQVSPNRFLPPDEQFAVGGVNTVRAFEEGQLTGDSGYTFSFEYNITLHEAVDLSVFLDHGAAFSYKGDDEPINIDDFLTGTGVGLTVRFSDNLWWRIQAGIPVMPRGSYEGTRGGSMEFLKTTRGINLKQAKVWMFVVMVGVLLWSGSVGASNTVLIGIFDIDTVIEQSNAGILADNDLRGLIAAWQEHVDSLETAIVELMDELENPATSLSSEQVAVKEGELQALLEQYQLAVAEAEYNIQLRAEELHELLLQDIAAVVALIGDRGGYTLIADTTNIFYFGSHIDITAEVINEYNRLLAEQIEARDSSGVESEPMQ
ncbi:MAG: BamA/TamA family outer membrane protein [Firmicutes bacterium]|nr:BamA/TamA family outer membrane protein [Bacillota bacterium]